MNEIHIKAARDSLAKALRTSHPELLGTVLNEEQAYDISRAVDELIQAHLMALMVAQAQR